MPLISEQRLKNVFASAIPFSNNAEKKKCQELVLLLDEEEQEQAALTSYAYAMAPKFPGIPTGNDLRLKMAMRFARRHFVAEKGDKDVALKKMKETLLWRKENGINELRHCFDDAFVYANDEDSGDVKDTVKNKMAKYRYQVEDEFLKQPSYVSGFDLSGRAILVKFHRSISEGVQHNHLIHSAYLVERAIACTEVSSNGTEEKILSVCNFNMFKRANSAPASLAGPTIRALQAHYPERLKAYIIVWVGGGGVARTAVRALWLIFKRFIDVDTREKVQFIFTEYQLHQYFPSRVSKDEAMTFMIPDGKKPKSVGMEEFLYQTPYTCAALEEDSSTIDNARSPCIKEDQITRKKIGLTNGAIADDVYAKVENLNESNKHNILESIDSSDADIASLDESDVSGNVILDKTDTIQTLRTKSQGSLIKGSF